MLTLWRSSYLLAVALVANSRTLLLLSFFHASIWLVLSIAANLRPDSEERASTRQRPQAPVPPPIAPSFQQDRSSVDVRLEPREREEVVEESLTAADDILRKIEHNFNREWTVGPNGFGDDTNVIEISTDNGATWDFINE
jgi:hypothetical protein